MKVSQFLIEKTADCTVSGVTEIKKVAIGLMLKTFSS